MGFTPEQIKGRIKSVAKQNNADNCQDAGPIPAV